MNKKQIEYMSILGALLIGGNAAASDEGKLKINLSYLLGLGDNLTAEKSTFNNSPDQDHGIKAGVSGFKVGLEYPLSEKVSVGADLVHSSAEGESTERSSGTLGLEGEAEFKGSATVNVLEGYVRAKKKLKKVILDGKLGVFVGPAEGDLDGNSYVSSPNGSFAIGQSLNSSASEIIYGGLIGGRASIKLGNNLEVFVGAQYNAGTEAEWSKAQTEVRGSISGNATADDTTGSVNYNGGFLNAGIKCEW